MLLITVLKTIAVCWREEKVAESARAVSELGRELYDRLAVLSEHFATVGKRLDSTVQQDYAEFFFGNSSFENLPPRAGYYIGYLALKQLGKTRSLRDLAHLNQQQARPALDSALAGLAACPAVLPSRGR